MKVRSDTLASLAYGRLIELLDGDLGNRTPDAECIDEADLCLQLLRALSDKKKRFVVEVKYPS